MTDQEFFIRRIGEPEWCNLRCNDMTVAEGLRRWSLRVFPSISLDQRYAYAVVTIDGRTATYSVGRDGEVVRGFIG